MNFITYRVHHQVSEEILAGRYQAFNEHHGFYAGAESALEPFDAHGFHLSVFIDGNLGGALRLTECPNNFMTTNLISDCQLPDGREVIELGRVFVVPEYRSQKLLNVLLLAGLHISEQLGYEVVIGTESQEANLRMPDSLGFRFTSLKADFSFPSQIDGVLRDELIIQCDLAESKSIRNAKCHEYQALFAARGYCLKIG